MSYSLDIKHNNLLSITFGVIIGMFVTLLSLFIFSILYTYVDIPEYYNAIFATISLIIGSFSGGMFTVSKINEKGYLFGSLVGLIIFLIVFLFSAFISKNSVTLTTVFHFLASVISGCISGIIMANKETNKKYLR